MGNTRHITVNSISPTQILTSVDCTDVFVGEDPVSSGAGYPSTNLLVIKGAVGNPGRGVPLGSVYQFSQKSPGPSSGGANFGRPGVYPPDYPVGWVQAVTGSITVFIDEEGAS